MRSTLLRALMTVGLVSLAPPALFGQTELPRFRFQVGVVFAKLETSVRYDFGGGLIGLRVSFENDLGLEEYQAFPSVLATYRIGKRHHIVSSFYSLGRSGTRQLSLDIPFPDTTLTIGTTVETFFRTQVLTLGYGYSVLETPTASITPYLALYIADWEAGVDVVGTVGERQGEANLTAPLPMIGMAVYTKVAKRLTVGGNLGLFFLTIGDYGGSIVQINANVSYRLFSFLSLGAGLAMFSVDVQAEAPDFHGEIRYRYTGPELTAMVFF